MNNIDIKRKIEYEGFWYFFKYYCSPERIEDEELRKLAKEFVDKGTEIENYLDQFEAPWEKP